jgi:hypothetical protein
VLDDCPQDRERRYRETITQAVVRTYTSVESCFHLLIHGRLVRTHPHLTKASIAGLTTSFKRGSPISAPVACP